MQIAIVHNLVPDDATEADRDVLVQVASVSQVLERLAHEPIAVAATLNLQDLHRRLSTIRPTAVFNLVESLGASDWLAFAVTGLFDAMRLPYTGAPTEAILQTNHKLLAKERLWQAGLPTPEWLALPTLNGGEEANGADWCCFVPTSPYIIKAVTEHASVGLEDDCVVEVASEEELRERVRDQADRLGCACFAERYIEGREFNLSILASSDGPEVLPPAEIDFSVFSPEKPRIVGYQAKWDECSFEYRHTPRTFCFADADRSLLRKLEMLAGACWRLFGLRGYARVDFRVDHQGQPWILEVNANPCLSPDAGFAAALERASIPFRRAIQRILTDAKSMNGRLMPDSTAPCGAIDSPATSPLLANL